MKFINKHAYPLGVALVFGLIGFGANFKPLTFDLPPYQADLLVGLVFPLLVALAWGWAWGLLSATIGLGCQTLWLSRFPEGGWMTLISIPCLSLWVAWHGWCAQRKKAGRLPALNPYLAEIPFRCAYLLLVYAFSGWTRHWQPFAGTIHGIDPGMVHVTAIEQTVGAYVVLLVADVVLNLGPIRRIYGLDRRPEQVLVSHVIGGAVLFGILFWVVDGLVDYYKFREHLRFLIFQAPENIMDAIFLKIPPPDLFVRTVYMATCLVGGLLVSHLMIKQLEGKAALRQSEARYRRLHEAMWDAFVQMDMAGVIVDSNPAFQQMLGYGAEALQGMREARLTPEKWHAMEARIIAEQVIPQGKSEIYEKAYVRADGSVFPAELRTFLIVDDDRQPLGRWSIVRDITQRQQTESERQKTLAALKQSNEDLKQFAYVASHDLQEPLRMISSYTQLLSERYRDQLDEKAHKFIRYAVDGAQRMQALIRDLLAFSRVETLTEPFASVDARQTLEVAVANLDAMINETGTRVTWDSLPHVRADKTQLIQLFQNLISNGIKFRGPAAPMIHVSARQNNGCWHFSVRDNGIGIDPKYKEKIFIVFQRLHTRDVYPGTGIGLALCKRIIDRHRGRIWFESTLGQGATFYFSIPAQP